MIYLCTLFNTNGRRMVAELQLPAPLPGVIVLTDSTGTGRKAFTINPASIDGGSTATYYESNMLNVLASADQLS